MHGIWPQDHKFTFTNAELLPRLTSAHRPRILSRSATVTVVLRSTLSVLRLLRTYSDQMARRGSSAPTQAGPLPSRTLIVDPGAYTIKAGFASSDGTENGQPAGLLNQCRIIPNCIARGRDKIDYVGSDLAKCTDFGEMTFKRPVEKGYIVNWDAERAIWEHEFLNEKSSLHVSSFRRRFFQIYSIRLLSCFVTNTPFLARHER